MPTAATVLRRTAARAWQVGCVVLGWAALTTLAAPPASEYTIQNWQTEDGLPQSSVLAIEQTPDGYLWLATFGGLARFDGVRFTVFDTGNQPDLPSNRVVHLFVDHAGALWLITEGHDLACLVDGRCRRFGVADGLPPSGLRWVREDGRDELWLAGSKSGLWQQQNGRFLSILAPPAFDTVPLRRIVTDTTGLPWFHLEESLFGLRDGHLTPLPGPSGEAEFSVKHVSRSRTGGLWVVTSQGLRRYLEGQWRPEVWPCPDFGIAIVESCEDFLGNVWVASYRNGLFRFNPTDGWQQFTVESGLTTLSLRSVFCDREGNVWVGTDGGGLLRVKPRGWKMVTRREGLGIDAVHSVGQDQQGRIWFAGGTGKAYWLDHGTVSAATASPYPAALGSVWAVLPTRAGSVWIGTYSGKVFRSEDGGAIAYGEAEGLLAGSVRALLEDRQGAIWVGGFTGLSRLAHGQVTHYAGDQGLSSERVWALAEGASGCLYVGTDGGGLNVFHDGRFTTYTRPHGLPDDHIRALYVDAAGVLWIGTRSGGLSRFADGRFINYRVKGGLPARGIGPMVEDDQGRLWLASDRAILCVSRGELDEFAAGTRRTVSYLAYDGDDGLATTEVGGIQPACLKARDGRVWFGTAKGAAVVDPRALRVNPLPPPVLIEEVRIDDELVQEQRAEGGHGQADGPNRSGDPGKAGVEARGNLPLAVRHSPLSPSLITLRPQQRRLELRFTGLSLSAPSKVRFRYRMQGFDPDWVEGGTARSVSYTRLPPGRHEFHVTACNDSGVWNDAGACLGIVVLPPFHQTWWFRLLVLAAAAGVVSALFCLRVSRLKQLARLRGRIAGDLHDEIGSNLGGIILLSELTRQTPALPPEAHASLQEIHTTAQRSASAMRDIVWFLNPDFDTLDDMVARMREFAATLLAGVACEFTAPPRLTARRLPLELRRNLFFAFKEVLHNIVKHAGATRVSIHVAQAGRHLTLCVQDNGRGFDPARAAPGHGLRSLRQRTADLQGQLTIDSEPGRGTTITLTAALP